MMTMQRLKSGLETMSTVVVLAAASALLWVLFVKQPPAAAAAPPPVQDVKGMIAKEYLTNAKGSAPIALIEFLDFQCPACAAFTKTTLPALTKTLIDTGKVRYIVMHLPLDMHPQAVPAAEAAECAAEQRQFWKMHDILFQDQAKLAQAEVAHFSGAVSIYGANLNQEQFEACLQADKALARVQAHLVEAKRLGANATPTLFLGRMRADGGVDLKKRITGGLPAAQLVEEVGKL